MIDPHHILRAAQEGVEFKREITDPKAREVALAIQGKSVREGLDYALDKYNEDDHRHYIESMFLGGASIQDVKDATGITYAAAAAYDEYIFDRSVFRDRLDCISYVKALGQVQGIEEDQIKLYHSSLLIGPDIIAWRLNSANVENLDPSKIIRRCLADAMFRGLSHRLMPNAALTHHHVVWMKHTKELAIELNKLDPTSTRDAKEALKLALRHQDETVNAETSGIDQEKILH
jgi:hypothetical protein